MRKKEKNETLVSSSTQTDDTISEVLEVSSADQSKYDSRLNINYNRRDTHIVSFRHWHERMQTEHDIRFGSMRVPNFSMWRWCDVLCVLCRYIERVDYNKRLCYGRCCKFKTVKAWATGLVIVCFLYLILYELIGESILPGGTYFLLICMFLVAYLFGSLFIFFGLPSTAAHLVVGIAFANIPFVQKGEKETLNVMEWSEKLTLIIIIVRASLQLHFSQIRGHARFIMEFALIPLIVEFILIVICTHFFFELPWQWSVLQGTVLAPVSLATVISIIEKAKKHGFGSTSHFGTIMIAVTSIEIIVCLYLYSIIIAVIFSKGVLWVSTWWILIVTVLIQLIGGILIGLILGIVAGMLPDRRSPVAAEFRIIYIGTATTALTLIFHKLGMSGVGVLSSITMCCLASNIWSELGWHESSNPVLFFYSMVYYIIQPVGVSLVGFSVRFDEMNGTECGFMVAVVFIGIAGREIACGLVSFDKLFPKSKGEKIFVCICWIPKGAVEALLSAILTGLVLEHYKYITDDKLTLEECLDMAKVISQTTVIAILLTSPTSTLLASCLGPRLLKAHNEAHTPIEHQEERTV